MAQDDTISGGVTGRYASALFDLASESGALAQVEKDMTALGDMLAGSSELQRLVRSPVFSSEDQMAAIGAIGEKAGFHGLTINFLKLLARNRRMFTVDGMIASFRTLCARHRGEVTADVTSAHPLSADQLNALTDTLRSTVGKNVQVQTRVDPALLGGLVVKIGSRMVDSSIRTKLNALKTAMKEVR